MFTLCLTGELPTGAEYTNARLHKQRGWCRFEIAAASLIKHRLCLLDVPMLDPKATTFRKACGSMQKGRAPPQAPPAFADEMRADVAGRAVAFTAGADMEFVIGQYTHGFEEAFNTYKEKGYGALWWTYLGWSDEQAPRLLAALEYVRDHYPEGAKKISISAFSGNKFSEETKAKLKAAGAAAVISTSPMRKKAATSRPLGWQPRPVSSPARNGASVPTGGASRARDASPAAPARP